MAQQWTVSARTILKILILTGSFFVLLMVAYITRRELVWIGVAFFLAVALNPPVERIARVIPRRNRAGAAGVGFLILLAIVAFIAVKLGPPLIHQSAPLE